MEIEVKEALEKARHKTIEEAFGMKEKIGFVLVGEPDEVKATERELLKISQRDVVCVLSIEEVK